MLEFRNLQTVTRGHLKLVFRLYTASGLPWLAVIRKETMSHYYTTLLRFFLNF